MGFVLSISNMIIPLVIFIIILSGIFAKVPMFDTFVEGTKDGFTTVLGILPTLIGLMVAVGILRASGTLDLLSAALSPVANALGFPCEAVPLTFMRLVSSSASTGLLLDLFKNHGPDSFIGRFVSVMMCCTETVFYTMSVYFLSIGITKTRYTLPVALFTNILGAVISLYLVLLLF